MRWWAVTCEPSTTGLSNASCTRRPPQTVLTWTPYLQGLGLVPSRPSTTRGTLRRSKWMGTGSISGARIIVMTKRIWNVRVPYSRIRLVGIVGTPGRALRTSLLPAPRGMTLVRLEPPPEDGLEPAPRISGSIRLLCSTYVRTVPSNLQL